MYYSKLISSPSLWKEKKQIVSSEKRKFLKREERSTLTDYVPSSKPHYNTPEASPMKRKRIDSLDEPNNIPKEELCKCGIARKNKDCTFNSCKKCYISIKGYCKVSSHYKDKEPRMENPSNPLLENNKKNISRISESMKNGNSIWISYSKGTIPVFPRKVTPTLWVKQNFVFQALSHRTNPPEIRHFRMDRILEIRDEEWEIEEMEINQIEKDQSGSQEEAIPSNDKVILYIEYIKLIHIIVRFL